MKIQRKALELIGKEVAKFMTWKQIVDVCVECKVPGGLISQYTEQCEAKWFLLYNIMEDLCNSEDKGLQQINLEILKKVVHPLIFSGNESLSQEVIEKFNSWLKYDKFYIIKYPDGRIDVHQISEMTDQDKEEIIEEINDNANKAYRIIKVSSLNELTALKKSYQLLINIVITYFENIRNPNDTLNDYYTKILKIVKANREQIMACFAQVGGEFGLRVGFNDPFPDVPLYVPFRNLYSAQAILKREELSIEAIKIKMYEYLGTISDLSSQCEASDILAESNIQKLFNEISLYLSRLKENNLRDENIQTPNSQIVSIANDDVIVWPFDFKWNINESSFLLGDNKELKFDAADSIRKKAFKELVAKQGGWAEISKIAGLIQREETYARTVMGQLNEKIRSQRLHDYILIEPQGRVDKASSYRIRPLKLNPLNIKPLSS